jgi:hypothetical protein
MKKIYFVLCALAISSVSFAQMPIAITNPGFETWRTNTSGSGPTININAPTDWYGFDSLIINAEEQLVPAFLYPGYSPTDLHAQVFQENTRVHGGSHSAKIISVKQDTLGIFAGSLINAQPSLNIAVLTGGGSLNNAIDYAGGTASTLRVTDASAWVEYFPGKDSLGNPGVDSGTFVVQAISTIAGVDSVVGTGTLNIGATASFTQVTVTVSYIDTVDLVNKVRIIFGSGPLNGSLDSSTLYVDDVTMEGITQTINAVHNVTTQNDLVKVYPNPATGIIHLDGPQNAGLSCELVSVSGQVVATKALTGSDELNVSYLPAGMYFYTISDNKGNKVQKGNVTVNN